jgi:hypothetical protein
MLVISAAIQVEKRSVANTTKGTQPGDPEVLEDWEHAAYEDPTIIEKYTGAEAVSETLFVIACKAKHKNDIDGMTRDKAKTDEFTEDEFAGYVKKLQDANLAQMKETCGHVNNKASGKCLEHCTDNWAAGGSFSLPVKKDKCQEMCTIKHENWEKECKDQVQKLTDVYIAEQGNLANTKKCQQIHCKDFPATLVAKGDEAKDIKKEGCKDQCTKKQIEAKCQIRWGLQEDVERVKFQDECRTETKEGTLTPCKDDGLGAADDDKTKCMDDGMKKCKKEEKDCQTEAKAAGDDSMIGANADSICGVRKQVCSDQVTGKCKAAHKKDLKKVGKDCMKEHKIELKKCLDDKMDGKEKEYKKKCFDEVKPTCKEDCMDRCQIGDMRQCQTDMIAKAFGVTQKYCTQLWRWIFDSEQYDKKTMDPIPKSVGGGRFKLIKRQNE